jgi:hypothetical protein
MKIANFYKGGKKGGGKKKPGTPKRPRLFKQSGSTAWI